MSEIYDNSELGETYRGSVQDTAFPVYEENVPVEEDPNDLESAYDQLTLFEKLKDGRWQVRRRAYCELLDFFESGKVPINQGEDELQPETMVPWIQNMINEPNMIAMADALKALNAFLTHHTCSRPQLASFTGRLIDKLVLTKKNIQSNIVEILEKLLEGDEAHNITNEILKRLDHKNHKFLVQLLSLLLKHVKSKEGPDDAMTRIVFKSMLPLMSHSNKEARHLALEILRVLYSYIEEDFTELKGTGFGNLRHVQQKELEEALQNAPKAKGRRLVKLTDGSMKTHEGALKKGSIAQKVDLLALIPEKFLEVPYLVQSSGEYNQNEKKKKLEEFNQKIEQAVKSGCEIETHKDYSAIINLLIWMLEDKNILINTEAIKSIDHLVRILKNNFPQSKLKYILTLIVEKLDAKKKTTYNTSLIQVLDDCITFNCMMPENLCELLLYNAESNKNMNVRTSCVNWFGSNFVTFLTAKRDVLYANMSRLGESQRVEKPSVSTNLKGTKQQAGFTNLDPEERIERLLAVVYKRIQQIHKKEGNITLKKRCQQILDGLENLYATAEVISPPKEEPEKYNALNDISSIKGNSRAMNISNLTLPQGEYDEFNKENEYEEQHERTNRFEVPDTKRSEFAFENLKQAEKDQFAKLMAMFGEIKPKDEHFADKLDEIGVFVDKMNMEVLQACQKNIAQTIKRTLNNATDYRNIVRIFESANNLLIKINRICLEIHSDTLKVELKIMLRFLANVLNGKNLEKTLDSMYMTCSIEKFLSTTLELFEKVDTKYVRQVPEEKLANALRVYLNWLVVKVEKIQNVMFEEELLKGLERGFSEFRFNNLPQVHLGVCNVLSKRLKTFEEHTGNTSVRSYHTPKINKHKKTISVDTSNIKDQSRMDDLSEIEQNQISQKMTNIQEQAKSDVRGGLEKFTHLLSSLKKMSLDKLNMSHCMSPTPGSANTISPNRHWKRGLGRDSTPKMSEGGRFAFGDSIKKPNALQGLGGKEDSDQKKHQTQIDAEEAIKFLNNVCAGLTEKEMAAFELSLFKLKSLYAPKDFLHILSSITPRLLARDCFNTRIPEARIIKMLKNHLEPLDKAAYLRTLKALFCMKYRENDMETAKNAAKVGLDLTSTFFGQTRFPHKVAPIIVEMVVHSLTLSDLHHQAEEILEMITKSVGRDGLRRIFEVELISSTKLYQIFINWVDQHQQQQPQPFGSLLSQAKREVSPLLQQNRILEEENETHTLIDDSFNNSITPQKQPVPVRRKSPTVDLRHSFDKALEEAEHQDLNQLSQILNTEENFDEPNFGTSFGTRRPPEMEQLKGLLDRVNRFETTDRREQPGPDTLDSGVPSFAQFKQNIKNAVGTSDFTTVLEEKEAPKKTEPQHKRMGHRPILGERNMEDLPGMIGRGQDMGYQQEDKENVRKSSNEAWFGKGVGMKKEEIESTPEKWKTNKFGQEKEAVPFMPSREMVVGHQMDSSAQQNKENMEVNTPQPAWHGQGMMKKEVKDGSAEKWKGKYIQEKERLQQTLELLEKANTGYLNHVTEKTDILGKLNSQRQMNEALYEKFNSMASENEKLKKEVLTFESEREKMNQQSLLLSSNLLQSKQDYKKFLNLKFISEALPIAAKGQSRNKEDFIKQFQEILLVSDNLELEVGESLMKIYEELEEYGEKVQFVVNLKDSVSHPQVLGNLSPQNHKFLLEIALKLCVSENTQREIVLGDDGVTFIETDLTNEMQLLLDGLLRFHSMNATISNLLRTISDQMPIDFESEMGKSQKMLLKLGVKCLVKLSSNFKNLVTEDIRVFDVLVEIYKLFKLHPPENLKEGQPNLKDFEVIFRNIRTLADHIIDLNPNRAKEFSTFFTRENNKSIFLDYVKSYTTKYYPNLSSSMNLSHASFE